MRNRMMDIIALRYAMDATTILAITFNGTSSALIGNQTTTAFGTTTKAPPAPLSSSDTQLVFQCLAYTTLGFAIVVLNTMLATTIFYFKKFRGRHEMMIYGALVISDLMCGYAYFTCGVYRLIAIYQRWPARAAIDCMKTVHQSFFVAGPTLMALFQMVVSIDRLIAVTKIQLYGTLGTKYFLIVLGVPSLATFAILVWGWFAAYFVLPRDLLIPATCTTSSTTGTFFNAVIHYIELGGSAAGTAIYLVVIILYRRMPKSSNDSILASQMERQRKVTKTLGYLALFTFLFYVVPLLTDAIAVPFMDPAGPQKGYSSLIYRLFTAAYSVGNVLLYLSKQSDVRKRMFQLFFRCGRPENAAKVGQGKKIDKASTGPSAGSEGGPVATSLNTASTIAS